ncbi:MAG: hypothetical protein JW850_00730 [Thermoflexales bacterium]|nr:hypothetical protein [Thermoflexales bacterium]
MGLALLVLIVVVVVAYALDWPPLAQINAYSPSTLQQPADLTRSPGLPEPAFVVLGEYNDEIYTFNRGVKRVYAYSGQTHKERQICSLAEFEAFWWHSSGKVLVLSRAYNPLGSLYLLDLASSSPKPSLITDRESDPRFPRSLSLEASLPLAWAKAGDKIAFVARDAQNNAESLFIFEIANTQLIYTPARNLGRISSLVWVEGDKKIALVAISDGQENRYLVEQSGGGFTAWTIQD